MHADLYVTNVSFLVIYSFTLPEIEQCLQLLIIPALTSLILCRTSQVNLLNFFLFFDLTFLIPFSLANIYKMKCSHVFYIYFMGESLQV